MIVATLQCDPRLADRLFVPQVPRDLGEAARQFTAAREDSTVGYIMVNADIARFARMWRVDPLAMKTRAR